MEELFQSRRDPEIEPESRIHHAVAAFGVLPSSAAGKGTVCCVPKVHTLGMLGRSRNREELRGLVAFGRLEAHRHVRDRGYSGTVVQLRRAVSRLRRDAGTA